MYVYFTEVECETCEHRLFDVGHQCYICKCKRSENYGLRVEPDESCIEYSEVRMG